MNFCLCHGFSWNLAVAPYHLQEKCKILYMESEATGLASAETWSFGGHLMELRGLMLLMRKLLASSVHMLSGSLFIPDLLSILLFLSLASTDHWRFLLCPMLDFRKVCCSTVLNWRTKELTPAPFWTSLAFYILVSPGS